MLSAVSCGGVSTNAGSDVCCSGSLVAETGSVVTASWVSDSLVLISAVISAVASVVPVPALSSPLFPVTAEMIIIKTMTAAIKPKTIYVDLLPPFPLDFADLPVVMLNSFPSSSSRALSCDICSKLSSVIAPAIGAEVR